MSPCRKQRVQKVPRSQRPRSSTIISPAGYIHDYHWHAFSALILLGSFLAFIAGYVNTICVVGIYRTPLTAFTGSTSKMAIVLAQGSFSLALHNFLLIFSFTLGSSISAALVGGSSFRIQRYYGLVLLLESITLTFGCLLEVPDLSLNTKCKPFIPGAYLVCLGCGLQNGMCTTFSGAVIRTTHVSGILTDIGLIIGQAIFHQRTRKHLWKLKILIPLYASFCLGAIAGWFAFKLLYNKAILLPCGVLAILGIGHILYCKVFLVHKLHEVIDTNEGIGDSTRLSFSAPETIPETSILSDNQFSDTDKDDSDEEEANMRERLSATRNSFNPLVVTTHGGKEDQDETL